jgi:hypothetical protein
MRKFMLLVTCAVAVTLAGAGTPSASSADTDVFQGTWTSTDLDGSQQQLDIRGSAAGTHAVSLYDDSASVACGGSPAHVQGTGDVDGNSLVMTGTLTCQPGGNPLAGRISIGFTYSPGTDTLTDESGVIWVRS